VQLAKKALEAQGMVVVPFKITREEAETCNEIFASCAAIAFFGQFNTMF
jgi:hypothetical protein